MFFLMVTGAGLAGLGLTFIKMTMYYRQCFQYSTNFYLHEIPPAEGPAFNIAFLMGMHLAVGTVLLSLGATAFAKGLMWIVKDTMK